MNLDILSWTEAYLKYKDTIHRRIKELKIIKDSKEIICEQKDGTAKKYKCVEDLSSLTLADFDNVNVSCFNTKKNFDWLINNWLELKELNTTILFANPTKATHWSINPRTHNAVSDKSTIKNGLKSLFESIPEV